ncbi:MAG: magnesium chelatase subunit D [Gammaproteobacteria bacterium]
MTDAPQLEQDEPALALQLLAIDPVGLGGIALRGMPGPGRSAALALLKDLMGDRPQISVPINTTEDRLVGGLDIAATLQSGRPLFAHGLLMRSHDGLMVLSMAERLSERVVGLICQTLDKRQVIVEREGISAHADCAMGVIALDESLEEDEHIATSLADRLAFELWTDHLEPGALRDVFDATVDLDAVRRTMRHVDVPEDVLAALTQTALALGVFSLRPVQLAVTAARALAALHGLSQVSTQEAATAARLVLSHRALHMTLPDAQEAPPEPEAAEDSAQDETPDQNTDGRTEMSDSVVQAARAVLPEHLLKALAAGVQNKTREAGRGAGASAAKLQRGRPIGVRGVTRLGDDKLNILATAKAAAPWQRLRGAKPGRLRVLPEDFRVTRYKTQTRQTTIFVVDASGSSAAQRLAEVKGAVELLLGECYVTRAEVAVVAFRKLGAEVLLPPTRSLTRARRELADLPGGGATPLANAIDVTRTLCEQVLRLGQQPNIVFLTDGHGNVGRDGTPGHADATEHALEAARELVSLNVPTVVVDTSRRPRDRARRLADSLCARYVPLPYADAGALADTVVRAA